MDMSLVDSAGFPLGKIWWGGYRFTPPLQMFGRGVKYRGIFVGGYWGGTADFWTAPGGVHAYQPVATRENTHLPAIPL